MNIFQAVVLGLVQGLGEFLPISSSGHLLLAQKLFGIPDSGLLLEVLLHVGTLVAVAIVYFRLFWNMVRHPIKSLLPELIVATIPAVVATLLFGDFFDAAFSGKFLGVSFLITSAFLLACEFISAREHSLKHEKLTWLDAIVMGVMQAVAILPGVSRSGSTMAGGISAGLNRKKAADFSFMMSAPAILGSLVLELKDLLSGDTTIARTDILPIAVAVIVAGVSGYLAIRFMLKIIKKCSLKWFALYTGVLGVLVLCDQLFIHWLF